MRQMNKKHIRLIKNNQADAIDDITMTDDQGRSALYYAIKNKAIESLVYMLESGLSPNELFEDDNTPLHLASQNGFCQGIGALIDNGAYLNVTNTKAQSPLMLAALKGDLCSVEALMERGGDVNISDDDGNYAVYYAIQSKNPDVFETLVRNKTPIEPLNEQKETLHHTVARYGTGTMQSTLFKRGITPYITNIYDQSPLHLVAKRGHDRLAVALIEWGLEVSTPDRFGYTPMDYAQDFGALHTLFERSINDTETKRKMAEFPLQRALRTDKYDEAEALIRMNTPLEVKDVYGNLPLFYLIVRPDPLLLKMMIRRMHGFDSIDAQGHSAYYYAALLEVREVFTYTGIKKEALDERTLALIEASQTLHDIWGEKQ